MAIKKIGAAAPAKTVSKYETVALGDMSTYTAGFGIPEGDYCLFFQPVLDEAKEGQAKRDPRLGVLISAVDLHNIKETPKTQFFSFGKLAHKSYMVNPDTGKGIVKIPDSPAFAFNDSTNWAIFMDEFYNSGLPVGIFSDDFSVVDGVHVHISLIPEPAGRAQMGNAKKSSTGEAAQAQEKPEERKPMFISVISEIKEEGKPWEGTGGMPKDNLKQTPAAPAPKGAKPAPALAKAAVAPAPPAAPAADGDVSEEDLMTAALEACGKVIEKTPDGMTRVLFRINVLKLVKDEYGDAVKDLVTAQYFQTDDAINSLIGQLGYLVDGNNIVPKQ